MTQNIRRTCRFGITLMCASALTLTGCGSSFETGSSSANTTPAPSGNGGSGNTEDPQWKSLSMDGSLMGGRFSSMKVVAIDKVSKELVLSLPMPANPYIDGISLGIPLPNVPGARVGLEAIAGGGSAIVLRVPLSLLMKDVDVNVLPPNKLPNGDPLPALPDGELPSMAIQINNIKNINATMYFSVQTLGIFINTPFDPMINASIPIESSDGLRTFGYLHVIPAKKAPLPAADGGFFIAVQIPDDLARVIDNNL